MTNASILTLLYLTLLKVGFSLPSNPLVGRWQRKFPDGRRALAVFRADSSLDFFIDGKAFGHGRYYVRRDTFGLSYPSCNGAYYGIYRLGFFTSDSVRFTVVEDTCMERQAGMNGVALGRVE